MRWPWISRAAFDVLATQAAREVDRLRSDLVAEQARTADLLTRLTALQRQGFVPPTPAPSAPEPNPNNLPADVELAIAEHMSPTGPAGRLTAAMARRWLQAGVDLKTVVTRIHLGAEPE